MGNLCKYNNNKSDCGDCADTYISDPLHIGSGMETDSTSFTNTLKSLDDIISKWSPFWTLWPTNLAALYFPKQNNTVTLTTGSCIPLHTHTNTHKTFKRDIHSGVHTCSYQVFKRFDFVLYLFLYLALPFDLFCCLTLAYFLTTTHLLTANQSINSMAG